MLSLLDKRCPLCEGKTRDVTLRVDRFLRNDNHREGEKGGEGKIRDLCKAPSYKTEASAPVYALTFKPETFKPLNLQPPNPPFLTTFPAGVVPLLCFQKGPENCLFRRN